MFREFSENSEESDCSFVKLVAESVRPHESCNFLCDTCVNLCVILVVKKEKKKSLCGSLKTICSSCTLINIKLR